MIFLLINNCPPLFGTFSIYKCILAPGLFYDIQVYGIAAIIHLNPVLRGI